MIKYRWSFHMVQLEVQLSRNTLREQELHTNSFFTNSFLSVHESYRKIQSLLVIGLCFF